jgi:hypothetical protein
VKPSPPAPLPNAEYRWERGARRAFDDCPTPRIVLNGLKMSE